MYLRKTTKSLLLAALLTSVAGTGVMADDISDLTEQKAEAQAQVSDLQGQLADILTDMNDLQMQADSLNTQIEENKQKLEEINQQSDEQKEKMYERIRYMYENQSNSNAAEILLTSSDFADFLKKSSYVSSIYQTDRDGLEQLAQTQSDIESLNEQLQQQADDLQASYTATTEKSEELSVLIQNAQGSVDDLDAQIQSAAEEAAKREAAQQASLASESSTSSTASSNVARILAGVGVTQGDDSASTTEVQTAGGSESEAVTEDTPAPSQITEEEPAAPETPAAPEETPETPAAPADTSSQETSTPSHSSDSSIGAQAVAIAESYIGTPYVWGGTDPSGFDCSGLTQYVFAQLGIGIPRTSGQQLGAGYSVGGLGNAQPGDLVLCPGHVGIYAGGGMMINATQPGDIVRYSSVSSFVVLDVRRVY